VLIGPPAVPRGNRLKARLYLTFDERFSSTECVIIDGNIIRSFLAGNSPQASALKKFNLASLP
jgi:hypothetical protein